MALGFKDFLNVDYTQTGDEQLARNAKKRKMETPTGDTNEEAIDANEALTLQTRRKKAIAMRRNKVKLAMGRRKASKRIANPERLKKRARRAARNMIYKKLIKQVPKDELSPARKAGIEKRLEKPQMQKKISMIARKTLKDVRKAELAKRSGRSK